MRVLGDSFLPKPFEPDELIQQVSTVIHGREGRNAA